MNAFFIVIYAICAVYILLNFKHDLQMFQQNSYRISRYWKWLSRGDLDSAWRLVDVACLFLLCAPQLLEIRLASLFVGLTLLVKIFLILRRKAKKPLVFTKRVWRQYITTAILALGGGTAIAICTAGKWYGIYYSAALTLGYGMMVTIFSWAVVIISATLLSPVEKYIQNRYIRDAKRILRSKPDLKVIGITGSYGKTSTKHYLTRILQEKYDVLMTPGSFNTPMGVVRTVREYLKPYNEIFVCEMGAKQLGDIKEICNIVHPEMGIVTAVGPMHLESFKSIENVCTTKFELIDALPSTGFAAVNNDFEMCADRKVDNCTVARYGVTNTAGCQYWAGDIRYSADGTRFKVYGPDNFELELETRLLGECNVSDLLAAVVIAHKLGVSPEQIKYAVGSIQQVEHRLSVKQTPGGVTILDDAFNSNPAGSRMAVDVLSHFTTGKRIIVTPGMIELGDRQMELNRGLGIQIGEKLDVAIIVGKYNREALVSGIEKTGFNKENLIIVDSFNEAQQRLAMILKPGDTVLYENDLPDTFK
ncbi:MAG: UDP-N-acetylmuramoyl-tripeptide--D-alanyl-D-alanine ligase [Muribaculaceae bacterium]|nr:UDP-N-acetylmuramoyl-tripeptide--D-alanyl-D-alanine ligase [Muribaculaceae bacterium]